MLAAALQIRYDAYMPLISTARLTLRQLTLDDAPFIMALLNEPDFIRFIADRNIRSLDDAQRYLENGPLASYARNGFGLWCVERTSDQVALGMCGLIRRDGLDAVDIGYAYLSVHYGHGYATEAARGVVAYGREVLALPRVVAIVDPGNTASIHVLKKIGLRFERMLRLADDDIELKLFA
jgi:[ribosomal protein S5]-alanine N-acetyltransferase